jgi:hypothetical protein
LGSSETFAAPHKQTPPEQDF